mgnify:FL=1
MKDTVKQELRLPGRLVDKLDRVQQELGLRYRQDVIRLLISEALERRRDKKAKRVLRERRQASSSMP